MSKYETILFSSAFSLAYHGFLRVGELTANSNGKNQSICIDHFKFKTNHKSGEDYIELKIPFSKTDQSGKGVLITLEPAKNSVCPVFWLKKYLSIRPNVSGQLVMHLNGSPLTRFQFCSIINKSLEFVSQNLVTNLIPSVLGRLQIVSLTGIQNQKSKNKVDGVPMLFRIILEFNNV